MSLINEVTENEFDLTAIKKGWLIWFKHESWDFDRKGIVTAVKKDVIVAQYYPQIDNVTNHTFIPVDEVVKGQWEIRWSDDLTEVWQYPEPEPEPEPEPDTEPTDP